MPERISRHLPIVRWSRDYPRAHLRGDVVAGLTVAVMLVPQGMAYANLAGMPPVTGLYAAIVGIVAYAVLGTSGSLAVGPVAITSLLKSARNVLEGQIVQGSIDSLTVRIVPLEDFSAEDEELLQQMFTSALGEEITIRVEKVGTIHASGAGKKRRLPAHWPITACIAHSARLTIRPPGALSRLTGTMSSRPMNT